MRTNVKFEEKTVKAFGGINVREDSQAGELTASENMCSQKHPALCSRDRRTLSAKLERTINGTGSFEGYIYTSYTSDGKRIFFTYQNTDYEYTSYTKSEDFAAERKFAALADCILIIPDNVIFWIATKKFEQITSTQNHSVSTARAKFKVESKGMTYLDSITISHIAMLTSTAVTSSTTTYTANGGTTTFYYCSFSNEFEVGEVVTLKINLFSRSAESNAAYTAYRNKMAKGVTVKIKSITTTTYSSPSGTVTNRSALVFEDAVDTGGYSDLYITSMTIERTMPALSDICSFGNRIWAISGKEIMTSKLSDAAEWNDFSVDDYGTLPYACFNTAAQTEGDFTAIVPYGNYIYAFKENSIHRIFGDSPDEYTLHTEIARGVGKGMGKCLCVCAGSVIYAASDGIYRYRGDYPQKISECLGDIPTPVDAAATEEKYYLLCDDGTKKLMYVYDIRRDMWHTESVPDESAFLCSYANGVCLFTKDSVINLCRASDIEDEYEKNVSWQFKMRIDDKLFGKKGYGRLSLRYSLSQGAAFTVRAHYDDGSSGAVCGACYDEADSMGCMLFMPIKRCLWFELEFKGIGEFTLKSMKLKFYRGSEI